RRAGAATPETMPRAPCSTRSSATLPGSWRSARARRISATSAVAVVSGGMVAVGSVVGAHLLEQCLGREPENPRQPARLRRVREKATSLDLPDVAGMDPGSPAQVRAAPPAPTPCLRHPQHATSSLAAMIVPDEPRPRP